MRPIQLILPIALTLVLLGWNAFAAPARMLEGTVNLNTATRAELELLPGVGQSMAERIIAYREKRAFQRTEELVRVRGVGRKTYRRLAPHLAVVGPTTLTRKENRSDLTTRGSREDEASLQGPSAALP